MNELLSAYTGQQVVVETDTPLSYLGRLEAADETHIKLTECAIYDEVAVQVSLDEYLIEAMKYGPAVQRHELLVKRRRVVAIGPLDQVVDPMDVSDDAV